MLKICEEYLRVGFGKKLPFVDLALRGSWDISFFPSKGAPLCSEVTNSASAANEIILLVNTTLCSLVTCSSNRELSFWCWQLDISSWLAKLSLWRINLIKKVHFNGIWTLFCHLPLPGTIVRLIYHFLEYVISLLTY